MIHVYALIDREPRPLRSPGLDGQPVMTARFRRLRAAYSEHDPDFRPEPTPDALWAQEAVVDELLELGPVVPIRFGTLVPDLATLRTIVAADEQRFTRVLEKVRGRVELAVRLAAPEDERTRVLTPLESMAAESSRASAPDFVKASYLVDRGNVQRFASLVRSLQDAHPDVALSCTGPWPPYSFVGGEHGC